MPVTRSFGEFDLTVEEPTGWAAMRALQATSVILDQLRVSQAADPEDNWVINYVSAYARACAYQTVATLPFPLPKLPAEPEALYDGFMDFMNAQGGVSDMVRTCVRLVEQPAGDPDLVPGDLLSEEEREKKASSAPTSTTALTKNS